jgi:hypothetical protein
MDADVSHLQKFADVPYVIEAPASKSRAASAAAQALGGVQVRFDDTRPLPKGRYGAIVESVRAQINEDLRPDGKWRIDVFDRSAKDLTQEGRRIDRTLSGFRKSLGTGAEGAFAQPFPVNTTAPGQLKGCIVVGFPASTDPRQMMSAALRGAPVPMQGLTAEKFHRHSLWHELGHCLLGNSEARADTFASLMALRHNLFGKDTLATLASWREVNEWTTPQLDDEHFIAASLWEVVSRADALQADKRFMAMGIEEIAGLAKTMSDRFSLGPEAIRDAVSMRRAFYVAAALPHHLVPGPGGKRVKGDLQAWGAAHSDIPEIARMDTVSLNLLNGAKPLQAFAHDMKALRARLDALVASGDPTAKAMVASLDRPAPAHRHDPDFEAEIPYRFKATDYARQVLSLASGARLDAAAKDAVADPEPELASLGPGPR